MADFQPTHPFACEAIPASAKRCEGCENTFHLIRLGKGQSTKRYCSDACQRREYARRYRSSSEFICQQCGAGFRPKRNDRTSYCSRQCSFEAKRERAAKRECPVCSTAFMVRPGKKKKFCSATCRTSGRMSMLPRVKVRHCACGSVIEKNKHRCYACKTERDRQRQRNKRTPESRRRHRAKYGKSWRKKARHYGVPYEPINITAVFERDRWHCQLCGCKTPQSKRGLYADDAAPTLDHIVPISKGGPHLYANVQCACRKCNTMKGNKRAIGQLSFFPKPLQSMHKRGGAG